MREPSRATGETSLIRMSRRFASLTALAVLSLPTLAASAQQNVPAAPAQPAPATPNTANPAKTEPAVLIPHRQRLKVSIGRTKPRGGAVHPS